MSEDSLPAIHCVREYIFDVCVHEGVALDDKSVKAQGFRWKRPHFTLLSWD